MGRNDKFHTAKLYNISTAKTYKIQAYSKMGRNEKSRKLKRVSKRLRLFVLSGTFVIMPNPEHSFIW
jgi:hypothetical protein